MPVPACMEGVAGSVLYRAICKRVQEVLSSDPDRCREYYGIRPADNHDLNRLILSFGHRASLMKVMWNEKQLCDAIKMQSRTDLKVRATFLWKDEKRADAAAVRQAAAFSGAGYGHGTLPGTSAERLEGMGHAVCAPPSAADANKQAAKSSLSGLAAMQRLFGKMDRFGMWDPHYHRKVIESIKSKTVLRINSSSETSK